MTMPFGNQVLDRVFAERFKPAVSGTGFDQRGIIDKPPTGLIDDRLRVEIRKSRFTICELSNRNPGAYWEGGFAEGSGRPVIYTCEEAYFQTHSTHFDTNHCHTVLWTEMAFQDARERLKATIRATLPQCFNLGRVGERGTPQQSQIIVIRVDHTVSRHGYEFAAEWMQAEPVKLVGQACFSGESPDTIIAQNGGLNVTESLRIAQVIQHEKT